MKTEDNLREALIGAGFPPELIEAHWQKFERLWVEIRAQELEFWGKYFVRTGKHYRTFHAKAQTRQS